MIQERKSAMGGWLSTRQVSELIPRSTRWIRDKMKAGAFGDAYLVEGEYWITRSGLEAYMERQKVGRPGVLPRRAGNIVQASAECRRSAA